MSRGMKIVLVLAIIVALWFAVTSFNSKAEPIRYEEYTVSIGDTVWDIAMGCSNGQDVRKLVYEIRKLNNIDDGIINAGDVIQIPIY